jgi:hypothetical protein
VAVTAVLLTSAAGADQLVLFEDFETGASGIDSVRRLGTAPAVTQTPPVGQTGAFPPPSGQAVLTIAPDPAVQGLGAAITGPVIDRRDPSQEAVTFEARLHLLPSGDPGEHNFALVAIDDSGAAVETERHHRLGYRAGAIYHQRHDGRESTTAVNDGALGSQLRVPGWHTFAMRFEGPEVMRFFVDGQETNFSPIHDASIPRVRLGVLAQNTASDLPLLVDDLAIWRATPGAAPREVTVGATGTAPEMGSFYRVDGIWNPSPDRSNALGRGKSGSAVFIRGGQEGSVMFAPNIAQGGHHDIHLTWPGAGNASGVLCTVNHADGSTQVALDQDGWAAGGTSNANQWHLLGTFRLNPGPLNAISVTARENSQALDARNSHRIYADAVRLVPSGRAGLASEGQVGPAGAGAIGWRHSFYAARLESRTSDRLIVVYAHTSRSRTCQEVQRTALSDPAAIAALNEVIPVGIDLEESPDFGTQLAIYRVPTLILIHPDGHVVDRHVGRFTVEELLALLR